VHPDRETHEQAQALASVFLQGPHQSIDFLIDALKSASAHTLVASGGVSARSARKL